MGLFIVNLIVAALLLVQLMKAKVSSDRGTNAVTRFVRDSSASGMYRIVVILGVPSTLSCFVVGQIFGCPYACLPTLSIVVLSFVMQFQSNKSEQRVKDARVVTKTTGKVVAATGASAVALGCVATGVGAPAAAAIVAGTSGVMNVVDKSMDQMTDVQGPDITKEDFAAFNGVAGKISGINISNPEAFIEAANRAGIDTAGKDLGEVASNVVKFAPKAMLDEMPDGLSVEEQAMRVMGGNVK